MTCPVFARALFLVVFLSSATTPAWAHLGLVDPPSRYGQGTLKTGPCGRLNGARSNNVTTYVAGSVITLTFDEYIDHPGHFRIAFDEDGDDDFVDPACTAGCDSTTPTIERYSNANVLLDGIADTAGGFTTLDVPLPNVECNNCTLQVIQVMYDKPPYVLGGDDIYYQCADLILVRPPVDAGVPVDTGPLPDTGPGEDVGQPDLGPPEDGGAIVDSGPGPNDGGLTADSGDSTDVGPLDLGPTPSDGGLGMTAQKIGGGCATSGSGAASDLMPFLGLALWALGRRRP